MRPSIFFTTPLTLSSHLRHGGGCARAVSSSLRAMTTSRSGDGTIVIQPQDKGQHTASVILCHGLGDTADGWAEPAQVYYSQSFIVSYYLHH